MIPIQQRLLTASGYILPKSIKALQIKFLGVFWLMRMADWLQGPYFYEVYSSELINNMPVSLDLVSKLFLGNATLSD